MTAKTNSEHITHRIKNSKHICAKQQFTNHNNQITLMMGIEREMT